MAGLEDSKVAEQVAARMVAKVAAAQLAGEAPAFVEGLFRELVADLLPGEDLGQVFELVHKLFLGLVHEQVLVFELVELLVGSFLRTKEVALAAEMACSSSKTNSNRSGSVNLSRSGSLDSKGEQTFVASFS